MSKVFSSDRFIHPSFSTDNEFIIADGEKSQLTPLWCHFIRLPGHLDHNPACFSLCRGKSANLLTSSGCKDLVSRRVTQPRSHPHVSVWLSRGISLTAGYTYLDCRAYEEAPQSLRTCSLGSWVAAPVALTRSFRTGDYAYRGTSSHPSDSSLAGLRPFPGREVVASLCGRGPRKAVLSPPKIRQGLVSALGLGDLSGQQPSEHLRKTKQHLLVPC